MTQNSTTLNTKMSTRKLVVLAMLTAISAVLVFIAHFPIFPAAPFLEYDPADVPILISTFAFGPVSGLLVTVAVSLIQAITVSSVSGWIGAVMHIVSTGSFVIVAGNIYKRKHTLIGALVSLVLGAATMVVVMAGLNLLLTPLYMGVSAKDVMGMLLPVIIPFNALKAGINAVITFVLYKAIHKVILKFVD